MNFSIHLDESTASELERVVKESHTTRNALIRKAIQSFLKIRSGREWPQEVRVLAGLDPKIEPFERFREELPAMREEPF